MLRNRVHQTKGSGSKNRLNCRPIGVRPHSKNLKRVAKNDHATTADSPVFTRLNLVGNQAKCGDGFPEIRVVD